MPWLGIGDEVEVRGEKRQFWQLEWAEYTTEFVEKWTGNAGVPVSGMTEDTGQRAVRRLLVQETQLAYPGLTLAASDAKMAEYLTDYKYQGSRSTPNGAGGYTVTVTERIYDSGGWSPWIDSSELPEYGGGSGGEGGEGGGE